MFDLSKFTIDQGYVHYREGEGSRFVARFKHKKGSAKGFAAFLSKHFGVKEYFDRLADGEAPLTIARSKGYELPHIIKWRKQGLFS